MQCKEIMKQNVQFIRRDDEVSSAAEMMRNAQIGFLPVCNSENNKIVGTLTDRDITIRLVAEKRSPRLPYRMS